MNTLKGYIPALINAKQMSGKFDANDFTLLLTIENTEALSHTLKLPVTMIQPARIAGSYNNSYNKFRFEAYLSRLIYPSSNWELPTLKVVMYIVVIRERRWIWL